MNDRSLVTLAHESTHTGDAICGLLPRLDHGAGAERLGVGNLAIGHTGASCHQSGHAVGRRFSGS